VVVCVGSSCFLRGASKVIQEFERLIEEHAPGAVEIKGSFCMERCTHGVTVQMGGNIFTAVRPEDVPKLFEKYVLNRLQLG